MTDQLDPSDQILTVPTDGPTLAYVSTSPPTVHLIDSNACDLTTMPLRERALCRALLEYALFRLAALERCEALGLSVGQKGTPDA